MKVRDFSNLIKQWDNRIIKKLNRERSKLITTILRFFSFFGRETLWLSLISFYLLIWYDPFILSHISATFLTGLILILIVKQIVKRNRPFENPELDKAITVIGRTPKSRSFPSWHSYNAAAYSLIIGLYLLNSIYITFLFLLGAIIVSYSRINFGVHYPTDVIFGYLFGIIGFLTTIYFIGPFLLNLLKIFEEFSIHQIQYQQLNSLLFNNIGYMLFTIFVFSIIIILACFNPIKIFAKNEE